MTDRKVGNVRLMQKMNRLKVLNCLRETKNASRYAIAEETKLSLSSVTNIINYFQSKDIIVNDGVIRDGRVGRKTDLLRFNSSAYNFICVDTCGSEFTVYLTDLGGNVLNRKECVREKSGSFIESIVSEVSFLLKKIRASRVLGVGIVLAAPVIRGHIYTGLPGGDAGIDTDGLSEMIGKPVFAENAVITHAFLNFMNNESSGKAIFADLSEGFGAVLYDDGEIKKDVIGEIGHTTVTENGRKCVCGNSGCLAAMCITESTVKELGFPDMEECLTAYKNGDKKVKAEFENCGKYIGIGLANIINTFCPETLYINCGLCPEAVIDRAEEELKRRALPVLTKSLDIYRTNVSDEEAVKGTAAYLCDRIFSLDFESGIL